jgi:hypothetical protein
MPREPFAHTATLAWPGGDDRAPGGAITEELCGAVDHEPPCPLAAHFTSTERRDDELDVRVLVACEPADEAHVRTRIDAALAQRWDVLASAPDEVRADEADHAARLAAS